MKLFCWQQIPDTTISEILCNTKCTGVFLDAEHSSFSPQQLFSCIQTIKLSGKKCGVRFTTADDHLVRVCLDAGIDYAIFSTVNSKEYANKICNMCRYPRHGGNRGQGLVRENLWGLEELDSSNPKVIAMIETKEGIDILEDLVDMQIDYFLIGTYDLSASYGCVGQFDDKKFKNAIEKFKKIVPRDKAAIHLVRNMEEISTYNNNFSFFALAMDTTVILDSYIDIMKEARSCLDE